jgi:hypothetical protein
MQKPLRGLGYTVLEKQERRAKLLKTIREAGSDPSCRVEGLLQDPNIN